MTFGYSVSLLQRAHRSLLNVVQYDLALQGLARDLMPAQALILHHIAGGEYNATELIARGFYTGLNVSYNLRKLERGGYINKVSAPLDSRAVLVSLTPKGKAVHDAVAALFARQEQVFPARAGVAKGDLDTLNDLLRRFDRFCTEHVAFRL